MTCIVLTAKQEKNENKINSMEQNIYDHCKPEISPREQSIALHGNGSLERTVNKILKNVSFPQSHQ